jgi:hypothetical protein
MGGFLLFVTVAGKYSIDALLGIAAPGAFDGRLAHGIESALEEPYAEADHADAGQADLRCDWGVMAGGCLS